jgi:hypothetical protein
MDENEEICGETYDHDEVIDYEGPDGRQWSCRRCGAEGWEEPEEDPHAGCYMPHVGPDGYQDCDGRPL